MKLKLAEISNGDERWSNILLSKLTGQHIKDVEGFISMEFGEPVFEISRIVLGNGEKISVGGEHDIAYIEDSDKKYNLDDETLEDLNRQQDEED
jgi:hypothetical protein